MSEKYTKFDEKDPKTAERLAFLEQINAQTTDLYESWADLYRALAGDAFNYYENPTKANADFTVTLLLSFVMALEDLPEEGDVKAISRRTNEIMVMHPERTGVSVYFGEEAMEKGEESAAAISSLRELIPLLGKISSMARARSMASEPDDSLVTTPSTKTLH